MGGEKLHNAHFKGGADLGAALRDLVVLPALKPALQIDPVSHPQGPHLGGYLDWDAAEELLAGKGMPMDTALSTAGLPPEQVATLAQLVEFLRQR